MPTIYVADANFLLRLFDKNHPHGLIARAAATCVLSKGDSIVTLPQSFYEFYVVVTRPTLARDGFGLSPTAAKQMIAGIKQNYPLQGELPIFDEWERLVATYTTSGLAAHDARYVALMLAHGLTHILTFNTGDFNRYAPEGIVVVDPASIRNGESGAGEDG